MLQAAAFTIMLDIVKIINVTKFETAVRSSNGLCLLDLDNFRGLCGLALKVQCGNLRIFLPHIFSVKTILANGNWKVSKMAILTISEAMNLNL